MNSPDARADVATRLLAARRNRAAALLHFARRVEERRSLRQFAFNGGKRTVALIMSRQSNESDPALFQESLDKAGYRVVRVNADELIAHPERPFIHQARNGALTIQGEDGQPVEIDAAVVYDLPQEGRDRAVFIEELRAWGVPGMYTPLNTMTAVSDKSRFATLAGRHGLPHPMTFPIASRAAVRPVITGLASEMQWVKAARATGGEDCKLLPTTEAIQWADRYWQETERGGSDNGGLVVQPDISDVTELPNGKYMRRHLRIWMHEDQGSYRVGLKFWCVKVANSRDGVNGPTNINQGGSAVVVLPGGGLALWGPPPGAPANIDGNQYKLQPVDPDWLQDADGTPLQWDPPDHCIQKFADFLRENEMPFGGGDVTFAGNPNRTLDKYVFLEINLFHAMYWRALEAQCAQAIVDGTTQRVQALELEALDLAASGTGLPQAAAAYAYAPTTAQGAAATAQAGRGGAATLRGGGLHIGPA